MNRKKLFLAAALAASAVSRADTPRKKCIAFGWEFRFITPQQMLANAEKFKDTAIDGVGIYLMATNRAGQAICSAGFTSGPEWDIEAFEDQIPALRKLAETDHFRDSFLKCFDAPRKRIAWQDDAAWARIARNMGVVGRLSRLTGIRGINSDPEDYHRQDQYRRVDGEPPYDELTTIARRRGREVFGPLFREQPEARVLFYWFLTSEKSYFETPDPRAAAREKGDLWPAFADGILDALPPTARIIDGDEHAYSSDYAQRGFHVSACNQRLFAPLLLSPENRAKHALQVQTSFGLYLDMYVNDGGAWYFGPVNGSRVEHFRRNYSDAFKLADEYVWLWGERLPTVHWEGAHVNPSVNTERTWAEALPDLYMPMLALHDADWGLRRRKAALAAAGRLVERSPDTGRFEMECAKNGSILFAETDVSAGDTFAVSLKVRDDGAKAHVSWQDADGNWLWGLGSTWVPFAQPDSDGWRAGEVFVEAPMGARRLAIGLSAGSPEGSVVPVDALHVWKLH